MTANPCPWCNATDPTSPPRRRLLNNRCQNPWHPSHPEHQVHGRAIHTPNAAIAAPATPT